MACTSCRKKRKPVGRTKGALIKKKVLRRAMSKRIVSKPPKYRKKS